MIEIKKLTEHFENKTLPKEQWTHFAHFAVAFILLEKYKNVEKTLPNIRQAIKSYNISVGTDNTENAGYHETLTIFWLEVVSEYYILKNSSNIQEIYEEFIITDFASPNFPAEFYSKDLLFSLEARKNWVEPDIKPILEIREVISRNS